MTDRLFRDARQGQVLDELIALAERVRLGLQVLVHPALVQRVGVEQTGLRIERGVLPVLGAARRRPVLGRLHVTDAFRDVGLDRSAALRVDLARPVHLLVRLGRNQFAARAVEHVEKAVAVELHEHLAAASLHVQLGEDQLPAPVVVIGVVRRELVVPDDLARLGPKREHGRRVEVVARPPLRRPRRGIADAPVHEIELRIVGARDPGRATASLPGIAVLRPGFVALLAARRNRVAAPQMLAAPGVPAVDEAADTKLRAGDPGDEHTVRDERRDSQ